MRRWSHAGKGVGCITRGRRQLDVLLGERHDLLLLGGVVHAAKEDATSEARQRQANDSKLASYAPRSDKSPILTSIAGAPDGMPRRDDSRTSADLVRVGNVYVHEFVQVLADRGT
jgi:hypothetical protein